MTDGISVKSVGVLGATSFVGHSILPLLANSDFHVTAFTRQAVRQEAEPASWITLPALDQIHLIAHDRPITHWICVAPVWVLADYLPWMTSMGAKRVVALSSTSRFTKTDSSDATEQQLALRLAESEAHFIEWAQAHEVEWVLLRPTLIYGLGRDKNISEIARFIRRFSFFPLLGKAEGLRQPVHVDDLAQACFAALNGPAANRAYNLSGGETLTYREMVMRIFKSLALAPRLLSVPLPVFRMAVVVLRLLPRYRKLTSAMAERMNRNMVFEHGEAQKDLGFSPRRFELPASDLPQ